MILLGYKWYSIINNINEWPENKCMWCKEIVPLAHLHAERLTSNWCDREQSMYISPHILLWEWVNKGEVHSVHSHFSLPSYSTFFQAQSNIITGMLNDSYPHTDTSSWFLNVFSALNSITFTTLFNVYAKSLNLKNNLAEFINNISWKLLLQRFIV